MATFLYSDLSTAAIDQLVTRFGLFARNSLIHFGAGFGWRLVTLFRPDWGVWGAWAFVAYLLLQGVQMASPGPWALLLIDGLWDAVLPVVGFFAGWWVAGADVEVRR